MRTSSNQASNGMLKEKTQAPNFSLPDNQGKIHTLSDLKGKTVIVYFYPKDNTPGCTKQACDFRDHLPQFNIHNTLIYGISKDSESSHTKFIDKYHLNFTLLSDSHLVAHKAYQVVEENKTIRSTFLINSKGIIVNIWSPAKVEGHAEELLKAVQKINNGV